MSSRKLIHDTMHSFFFLLLLTNENTVLHRVLNPAGDQVQILWSCALTIFSNQAREHLYLFLFALIFQKFICFLFPVLARICCNVSCTLCPSLKTASSVLCHPVPPISLTLHLSIPVFVHPSIHPGFLHLFSQCRNPNRDISNLVVSR